MAGRPLEADRKPYTPPSGSVVPTSGVQLGQIGHKLVINVTAALTSFSIRTLDGTAVALGAIPVGLWTFDVQHDMVTWSGGTMAGIESLVSDVVPPVASSPPPSGDVGTYYYLGF